MTPNLPTASSLAEVNANDYNSNDVLNPSMPLQIPLASVPQPLPLRSRHLSSRRSVQKEASTNKESCKEEESEGEGEV